LRHLSGKIQIGIELKYRNRRGSMRKMRKNGRGNLFHHSNTNQNVL
jgi:hypothetical protein